MNRRTALKLAAATLVLPKHVQSFAQPSSPQLREGETWDSLAESMACWERHAFRDNYAGAWRTIRERCLISWNHRRSESKPDAVSLVYLSSPERGAMDELLTVARGLQDAGIPLLGTGATNDGHLAAAFVWGHQRTVGRLLGDWCIEPPPGRWH